MKTQSVEELVRAWAATKRDYDKKQAFLDAGLYRYETAKDHKRAVDEARAALAACEAALLLWAEYKKGSQVRLALGNPNMKTKSPRLHGGFFLPEIFPFVQAASFPAAKKTISKHFARLVTL